MPVTIDGSNTPTAGGIGYGDGTELAFTSAGSSGQALLSAGAGVPTWGTPTASTATTATNLAGGFAGGIPYQSAPGTTAILAAGSSGQLLQTNGAGAPSWATPSSGALTLLSTVTVSAAATADVETTFSGTYSNYIIVANGVTFSDANCDLSGRLKIGGSYITTSTYIYVSERTSSSVTTFLVNEIADFATPTTSILLATASIGNNAAYSMNFELRLSNPSSTTFQKSLTWIGGFFDNGGETRGMKGTGRNTGTAALTGVRFFPSAGTFSGTFRLYALANS